MHPNTPIINLELLRLSWLNDLSRVLTVVSAFSLIEHVFNKIKEASEVIVKTLDEAKGQTLGGLLDAKGY